jgi:hypothetical protein
MSIFSLHKNSLAAELAAKTPTTRDRYVDFLRAFSISVVVIGHWLTAVIIRTDGGIRVFNAIGIIPGLWVTTWVFQVMPLFFFVGGFSNLVTLASIRRRGDSIMTFLRKRATRLLKPTGVFLAIWLLIFVVVSFILKNPLQIARHLPVVLGPLWFLVVYLMVIVVTPVMRELHRSCRIWVLVILMTLIILVDILRFSTKIESVAWANIAFIWLFVHQFGFFYGDGSLVRAPKWVYVVMTLAGLLGLIILTNIGVYPKSMVGTGVDRISNMHPPTLCIAVHSCWLIGAAMLLRNTLNRWLARLRPWMLVITANSVIMTLYLWHITAYAVAFLILSPLGLGQEPVGTPLWWLQRLVWIIGPAIVLAGFIKIFARFERPAKVEKLLYKEEK